MIKYNTPVIIVSDDGFILFKNNAALMYLDCPRNGAKILPLVKNRVEMNRILDAARSGKKSCAIIDFTTPDFFHSALAGTFKNGSGGYSVCLLYIQYLQYSESDSSLNIVRHLILNNADEIIDTALESAETDNVKSERNASFLHEIRNRLYTNVGYMNIGDGICDFAKLIKKLNDVYRSHGQVNGYSFRLLTELPPTDSSYNVEFLPFASVYISLIYYVLELSNFRNVSIVNSLRDDIYTATLTSTVTNPSFTILNAEKLVFPDDGYRPDKIMLRVFEIFLHELGIGISYSLTEAPSDNLTINLSCNLSENLRRTTIIGASDVPDGINEKVESVFNVLVKGPVSE